MFKSCRLYSHESQHKFCNPVSAVHSALRQCNQSRGSAAHAAGKAGAEGEPGKSFEERLEDLRTAAAKNAYDLQKAHEAAAEAKRLLDATEHAYAEAAATAGKARASAEKLNLATKAASSEVLPPGAASSSPATQGTASDIQQSTPTTSASFAQSAPAQRSAQFAAASQTEPAAGNASKGNAAAKGVAQSPSASEVDPTVITRQDRVCPLSRLLRRLCLRQTCRRRVTLML